MVAVSWFCGCKVTLMSPFRGRGDNGHNVTDILWSVAITANVKKISRLWRLPKIDEWHVPTTYTRESVSGADTLAIP